MTTEQSKVLAYSRGLYFATLVTGASGFLGKAVMKLLAGKSHHAVGLDPRP